MSAKRPGPDPNEYEYLEKYLKANDQPFLELACGYGRLLLYIMEKGYSIIGTDSSPEMLKQCKVLAKERKLKPILYQQFMQKLSLNFKFGLIFIDDCTFTLVIEDNDINELFERVLDHLKPGGTFLFDFFGFFPEKKDNTTSYNSTNWVKGNDSSIYVSKQISEYDPSTHISRRLQIHDRYINGKFVGSQAYEDPNRNHNVPEIMKKLNSIGFVDVILGGYHTDSPPSENANMFSIRCKKL
jgi:SAM-dependent methyltransferase